MLPVNYVFRTWNSEACCCLTTESESIVVHSIQVPSIIAQVVLLSSSVQVVLAS